MNTNPANLNPNQQAILDNLSLDDVLLHTLEFKELTPRQQGQTLQALTPNEILGAYKELVLSYCYRLLSLQDESDFIGAVKITVDDLVLMCTDREYLEILQSEYSKVYAPPDEFNIYQARDDEKVISSLAQTKEFLWNFFFTVLVNEVNAHYHLSLARLLERMMKNKKSNYTYVYEIPSDFSQSEWSNEGMASQKIVNPKTQWATRGILLLQDYPLSSTQTQQFSPQLENSLRLQANKLTKFFVEI